MNIAVIDSVIAHQATVRLLGDDLERLGLSAPPTGRRTLQNDPAKLVRYLVAAFRTHGHIGNVMTHISNTHWDRIEEELGMILDPRVNRAELTPLALNIVDLLYAQEGVTGRIAKPYFEALLHHLLPHGMALSLIAHVAHLGAGPAPAPFRQTR